MSQQSNPATLREALREVNSLVHQMAIELDPIPAQPRVEYWTRKIEEVICTALAASGTEAAPRDVSERTLPGTCNYPFVAAGSKELGIELMITDRCELLHGHAGRHKNGNASWGQPAQAAASPEGEGREAFDAFRFEIEWHEKWVKEIKGTKPLRYDAKKAFYEAIYKAGFDAALRQSAAPSGGDFRALTRIADGLRRMRDGDRSGMSAQHMLEIAEQALAQESKTGAVTETK